MQIESYASGLLSLQNHELELRQQADTKDVLPGPLFVCLSCALFLSPILALIYLFWYYGEGLLDLSDLMSWWFRQH